MASGSGEQGAEVGADSEPAGGWRGLTNSTGVLVGVSVLLVCLVVAVAATIASQVNNSSGHPVANVAASSGVPVSPSAQVPVAGGLPTATPTTPKPSAAKTTAAADSSTTQAAGNSVAGAETQQPSQQPSQTPSASTAPVATTFGGASHVLLENLGTGMCADLPNYGAGKNYGKIEQFTCQPGNGDNQLWTLTIHNGVLGPNAEKLFTISNDKDSLCMDMPDTGAQPAGTALTEYGCHATSHDNQLWYLSPVAGTSSYYEIHNQASYGMCLNVAGGAGGSTNANLTINACSSSSDAWLMKAG